MFPYPILQGSSHYCPIPNCFQGFCSLFGACRGNSSKRQCVVVEIPYPVCSQRTVKEQHLLGKRIDVQDKGLHLWFPVRSLSCMTLLRYDCDEMRRRCDNTHDMGLAHWRRSTVMNCNRNGI